MSAASHVHVWVDETRPRNQGASLTAWELGHHGVPHTVIPDNTGGHLMQHGMVDLVIVGTDRVAANGDVCNKIGTYLKALAAHDNGVPFYVALPSPTIDFSVADGVTQIPIEQRGGEEVTDMTGRTADGRIETVRIVPEGSPVANYAFDVTPARLVTGLITERGVLKADRAALSAAFPERIARGGVGEGRHCERSNPCFGSGKDGLLRRFALLGVTTQLAQRQPRRRLEFGERLRRAHHLDRGHAHLARGLQIDAEIVEIDAFAPDRRSAPRSSSGRCADRACAGRSWRIR